MNRNDTPICRWQVYDRELGSAGLRRTSDDGQEIVDHN
jgi:hypothetical protein